MSQLPALADVLDETAALNGLTPRNNGFHLEPRCRVCRNDTLRIKVNNLLASGASYAMILRAVRDDNAKLEKRERVTIDSIRNHTTRHFPVQNVAKATYVATAITPMAFFETVMVKGYESLVDSGTEVDVNTGMIAAGRLQALIESRASGTRIADLMVQMDRIINAIHSTVPEELWPEILCKIDGPVAADTPADEIEDCDDAEDEYNGGEATRTAGLRTHGQPAEMMVKVDRLIAAVRSTVPPEMMHTAQAERRGRNRPSRWWTRTPTSSSSTVISPAPMTTRTGVPLPLFALPQVELLRGQHHPAGGLQIQPQRFEMHAFAERVPQQRDSSSS